ncbi:MAG: hypothetical protein ACM3U2_02825 [Deltaproteobacteria bacterium]
MPKISVIGIYAVPAEEPVHIVEIWVKGAHGVFDVGKITQETPGQPQSNWQVPYSELILNRSGDEVVADDLVAPDRPELWQGDVRMVFFFHYLDFHRPLHTPFGEVELPPESSFPTRLSMMKYEPP